MFWKRNSLSISKTQEISTKNLTLRYLKTDFLHIIKVIPIGMNTTGYHSKKSGMCFKHHLDQKTILLLFNAKKHKISQSFKKLYNVRNRVKFFRCVVQL